jgi:mRNA interferase HigB
MHVISRKRLNEFAEEHPDARTSLAHWFGLMKRGLFSSFIELRDTFRQPIGSASSPSSTLAETRFV